ncbi:MAG: XRE family transcriptional regulator [Tannerellaceae bacterium]|nr:XRE family transcriptional regulator [Tannerellaceae bacterium]
MEKVNEEKGKMTLGEYYKSLKDPQTELIEKLCKATISTDVTVRRWIAGTHTPPPIKQKIISKIIGRSMHELFPAKHIPEKMEE